MSTRSLHAAVKDGNIQAVISLIQDNSGVDEMEAGSTPLHLACQYGKREIVDILVRARANLNAKDVLGDTPLHWALLRLRFQEDKKMPEKKDVGSVETIFGPTRQYEMYKSDIKIVEQLIKASADVNETNNDGKTSLHMAAKLPNAEIFTMLINYDGIDSLNKQDDEGNTPLHHAAKWKNRKVAEILVNAGASLNVKNLKGETALKLAVTEGDLDLAETIIYGGAEDLNATGSRGQTALHLAVAENDATMVEYLLRHGADRNARDDDGRTPLKWAIMRNEGWSHANVIKTLLEIHPRATLPTLKDQAQEINDLKARMEALSCENANLRVIIAEMEPNVVSCIICMQERPTMMWQKCNHAQFCEACTEKIKIREQGRNSGLIPCPTCQVPGTPVPVYF